jgi:hypothetical protein
MEGTDDIHDKSNAEQQIFNWDSHSLPPERKWDALPIS